MSERAAFQYGTDRPAKKQWRSLEEYAETEAFQEAVKNEFPEGAADLVDPVGRRSFIGLMGASLGLAGLTGCRRPLEHILPYQKRPPDLIPGRPMYFATAFPFAGTAIGLLVESNEGRPTKIEGNPAHPDSLGSANHFAQGSILDLYDPDRSPEPLERFQKRSWDQAAALLTARGALAAKAQGAGLWILTEAHRSPTLARKLLELTRKWPKARVIRYDPLTRRNGREGAHLAFGRRLELVPAVEKAKMIVSLDSDFLFSDGSPVKNARGFANGRRISGPKADLNRLYVAEAGFSVTGANADHRLRLRNREIPLVAFALARAVQQRGVDLGPGLAAQLNVPVELSEPTAPKWIAAVADELVQRRAEGVLVLAGQRQPPEVHAVAQLLDIALGQLGRTVRYVQAFDETDDGPESLLALASAMHAGEVQTLLVLGGNPVHDAPADARFQDALAKVPVSIHLAPLLDETSRYATWHLNQAHYLEQWSDVRAEDGTASIVQPLIAPLFDGRTDAEVVELLLGGSARAYELVQGTWSAQAPPGPFEAGWRRSLNDGVISETAFPLETPAIDPAGLVQALVAFTAAPKAGFELVFFPDAHRWDGRFANNGWLTEMADPMTTITWDNAALLSPKTAAALGIRLSGTTYETPTGGARPDRLNYDHFATEMLDLTLADGTKLSMPAFIQPGLADDTIAVTIGWGRTNAGKIGSGKGFDVGPLRRSTDFWAVQNVRAVKGSGLYKLARTQEHNVMEHRPLAVEANVAEFEKNPRFVDEEVEKLKLVPLNLFSPKDAMKYEGQKWGMVIDLGTCIGCQACTIACQAENNIPIVGKEGVLFGREMHWIRIDRYYTGEPEEAEAIYQPVPCMQCENAPCELVCPVAATQHSEEGLNEMVYNRCVGTRYCMNNCPYKVRRFNWFNFNRDVPELKRMQFNPEVTVRSRGVMEKCTYCVQRIEEARIAAKREQRNEIREGEVIPACAQSCPTNAIVFGDYNDPNSMVSKQTAQPRMYKLLNELNTQPRTRYLARIKNPNPALESA